MLAERYQDVQARIAGRARLVAVSKGHPVESILALHALGQRDFGENRAEELAEKARALPDDIQWHFLGALQRNKLKHLVDARPWIHSFDRPELAPHLHGLDVLVQVHLGGGEHRNGLLPERIPEALEALARAGHPARGLMVLPPLGEDPRAHFERLRRLRDSLRPQWPDLVDLSMGMSEDYEIAIEEGATLVRVGRTLFGPRPTR